MASTFEDRISNGIRITIILLMIGIVLWAIGMFILVLVLPNARELGIVVSLIVGGVTFFYTLGYLHEKIAESWKDWL